MAEKRALVDIGGEIDDELSADLSSLLGACVPHPLNPDMMVPPDWVDRSLAEIDDLLSQDPHSQGR